MNLNRHSTLTFHCVSAPGGSAVSIKACLFGQTDGHVQGGCLFHISRTQWTTIITEFAVGSVVSCMPLNLLKVRIAGKNFLKKYHEKGRTTGLLLRLTESIAQPFGENCDHGWHLLVGLNHCWLRTRPLVSFRRRWWRRGDFGQNMLMAMASTNALKDTPLELPKAFQVTLTELPSRSLQWKRRITQWSWCRPMEQQLK